MLSDGDLIRNLLGRYCDLVDGGDWVGVGALFADGVLAAEDGTVLASGSAEVAAFYERGTRLHGRTPGTKHVVVNTVLEPVGGEAGALEARSSYVVLQAVDGSMPLQPIITGRYVDRFVRVGGPDGWAWRERRFSVDQVGDLSRHLTWAP